MGTRNLNWQRCHYIADSVVETSWNRSKGFLVIESETGAASYKSDPALLNLRKAFSGIIKFQRILKGKGDLKLRSMSYSLCWGARRIGYLGTGLQFSYLWPFEGNETKRNCYCYCDTQIGLKLNNGGGLIVAVLLFWDTEKLISTCRTVKCEVEEPCRKVGALWMFICSIVVFGKLRGV